MRVTPLEIRQQQFQLRFRGYDPTAVDTFLELVAGVVEELIRENVQRRDALAQKDQEIQGIREQEKDWKKALMAVQQTRDDLIERGRQQAESLVAEAERKVHQLLAEAERMRQAIAQDVQALTHQRCQLIAELRNLLSQHLAVLEAQEGQDEQRQSSGVPGLLPTTSAAPQTAGDIGHTAASTNDLAQKGPEGKARKRRAANLVRESQR